MANSYHYPSWHALWSANIATNNPPFCSMVFPMNAHLVKAFPTWDLRLDDPNISWSTLLYRDVLWKGVASGVGSGNGWVEDIHAHNIYIYSIYIYIYLECSDWFGNFGLLFDDLDISSRRPYDPMNITAYRSFVSLLVRMPLKLLGPCCWTWCW